MGNSIMWSEASQAELPLKHSVALARSVGDRWCLSHALALLGNVHLRIGTPATARTEFEKSIRVARRAADEQGLKIALTMSGQAAVDWGEYDVAAKRLAEALTVAVRLREPYAVLAARLPLGRLAVCRGDYAKAFDLLTRSHTESLEVGSPSLSVWANALLGRLHVDQGLGDAARAHFNAAVREDPRSIAVLLGLGELAILDRSWQVARTSLEEAHHILHRTGSRLGMTQVFTALSRLSRAEGDPRRALLLISQALREGVATSSLPDVAEALEVAAGLYAQGGVNDRAIRVFGAGSALRMRIGHTRAPIRQAQFEADVALAHEGVDEETFRALWDQGAGLSARRAAAQVVRGPTARVRPSSGWGSLTKAELEVTRWAADGYTNGEIGARLRLSPRTIETHLTHVFAKLGMQSRRELTRAVKASFGSK